ncbi:MAG: hypothetical protein RL404_2842 [Pseudomonadota bacterium]
MVHLPDAPLPHALDTFRPAGDARPEGLASSLACEIHEHAVPPFVRDALDRLYGSMYASWRHLQLCEADRPLPHTWVARHHGDVVGALLFRIEDSRVLVLTEMMSIGLALVEAFCRSVYDRYPQADVIELNAVDVIDWARRRPLCWPVQSYAFSEDYVIALPANVDAYRASLGKSTRKTITGYGNRVTRELPELRWTCREAAGMSLLEQRSLVRTLQRYKADGMQERGKHAAIDRRDTARLLMLARDCGMYGIARVDGRVVAGSLACRFGDHYVMLLSAADPALARYRLGFLACYWSICDCISHHAVACHLLWGHYDYKVQLLGQAKVLRRVQLYRSRLAMLWRPKPLARMVCQAGLHYGRSMARDYARGVKRCLDSALNGHS